MKRTSFENESKIVRDFEPFLQRFGGKAAGLLLLKQILKKEENNGRLSHRFRIPPYQSVSTDFYTALEPVFMRLIEDPFKHITDKFSMGMIADSDDPKAEAAWRALHDHQLIFAQPEMGSIISILDRELGRFIHKVRSSSTPNIDIYARSSSTIEDFVDDSYYGTFKTDHLNFTDIYNKPRDEYKWMAVQLASDFFFKKNFWPDLEIPAESKLGMVFMVSARNDNQRFFDNNYELIVHSHYPERSELGTVIETLCIEREMQSQQLTFIKRYPGEFKWSYQLHYKVHQAYETHGLVDFMKQMRAYKRTGLLSTSQIAHPALIEMLSHNKNVVNHELSVLSKENLHAIEGLAHIVEDKLGYPVNLEIIFSDLLLYPVQLRPVPMLKEDRPVKSLGSLPEEVHLIAETPFVIGSYKLTGPFFKAHDKNAARGYGDNEGIRIPEPYLMWHEHRRQGNRYMVDPNCIGLLSPVEGNALTHNRSILPAKGPYRDKFAFMGVPGLTRPFLRAMEEVEYPYPGRDYKVKFDKTPFPITIESDGRTGRLYVDKKYKKYFE